MLPISLGYKLLSDLDKFMSGVVEQKQFTLEALAFPQHSVCPFLIDFRD